MAKKNAEMTRCSGTMTEGRFKEFIKSLIRKGSTRWRPIQMVKKRARTARGVYLCAGVERDPHEVPVSTVVEGKRKNNVVIDHMVPVMSPDPSENSWDKVIERMFVEEDGLQVLCQECHRKKTNEELSEVAKFRRELKNETE